MSNEPLDYRAWLCNPRLDYAFWADVWVATSAIFWVLLLLPFGLCRLAIHKLTRTPGPL